MRVTFDSAKRTRTLAERGLDFENAGPVFDGPTVEIEDTRKDKLVNAASSVTACSPDASLWSAIARVA